MPSIKCITVKVEPWHEVRSSGVLHHTVRVSIESYGMPERCEEEIIPDDDFTRRFDYLMERAKRGVMRSVSEIEERLP